MVASQKSDVAWVLHLEAEEKLNDLHRVESSIDVVTHEDVAGIGYFTSFSEKLKEVVELSVNVTTNSDWSFNWLHVVFLAENLLCLLTENSELSLGQEDVFLEIFDPLSNVLSTHLFYLLFIIISDP